MKQEIREREGQHLPEDLKQTIEILRGAEEELLKSDSCGFSVLDWFIKLEENRKYLGRIAFTPETAASVDASLLAIWMKELEKLQNAAKRCADGNLKKFALTDFNGANYSEAVKEEMMEMFQRWREEIAVFETRYHAFCECFGIAPDETYDSFAILEKLCRCLLNASGLFPALLFSSDFSLVCDLAEQLLAEGKHYSECYGQLQARYYDSVFQCDWKRLMAKWKEADQAFSLIKSKKKKEILKELREYAKHPGAVTEANFVDYVRVMETYENAYQKLEDKAEEGMSVFGAVWQSVQTDWMELEQKLRDTITVYDLASKLFAINPNQQILDTLYDAAGEFLEFVRQNRVCFQDYLESYETCMRTEKRIRDMYEISLDRTHTFGWFALITRKLDAWENHLEELGIWSEFMTSKQSADTVGLQAVTEALREGTVAPDVIVPCVWSNLAVQRIDAWMQSAQYSRYLSYDDGEKLFSSAKRYCTDVIDTKQEGSAEPTADSVLYQTMTSRITTEMTFAGFGVKEVCAGRLAVNSRRSEKALLTILMPGADCAFQADRMLAELEDGARIQKGGGEIQIVWIMDWLRNPNTVIKKLIRQAKEYSKKAGL